MERAVEPDSAVAVSTVPSPQSKLTCGSAYWPAGILTQPVTLTGDPFWTVPRTASAPPLRFEVTEVRLGALPTTVSSVDDVRVCPYWSSVVSSMWYVPGAGHVYFTDCPVSVTVGWPWKAGSRSGVHTWPNAQRDSTFQV